MGHVVVGRWVTCPMPVAPTVRTVASDGLVQEEQWDDI